MKVIVTGPESSGSKLVSRIVAHVLNVCSYHEWNGLGCVKHGQHSVLHQSNPYNGDNKLNLNHHSHNDLKVIFTSRDRTCMRLSRKKAVEGYTKERGDYWVEENKRILNQIKKLNIPYFIFSYETFMLYEEVYLEDLYRFLGVDSGFIPEDLHDANEKYI